MFASKLDKPEGFIGAKALQKHVAEGTNRLLLQFLLEQNEKFLYHNEPIYLNGDLVGSITSGTYGHTLGAPVGLGWVTLPDGFDRSALEEQRWELLVAGEKVKAQASLQPLYDSQNLKLRT